MIQLRVASGSKAGACWCARRFPVSIGRSSACELRLDDAGVWEQHLLLEFKPKVGISLSALPNALTRVNGHPVSEILLRNGDTIELGAVRLEFSLSPVRQRSLVLREIISWGVILTTMLAEICVLYWLLA